MDETIEEFISTKRMVQGDEAADKTKIEPFIDRYKLWLPVKGDVIYAGIVSREQVQQMRLDLLNKGE